MNNQNNDERYALFLCSKAKAVKVTKEVVPVEPDSKNPDISDMEYYDMLADYQEKIKHLRETALRVDDQKYANDVLYIFLPLNTKAVPDTFYPLPDGYTVEFNEEIIPATLIKPDKYVHTNVTKTTATIKPVDSKKEVEQDDWWIGVEDSEKPKGGIPLLVAINEVVKEAYYNASFRSFHIKSTLPEEQGDIEVYPTDWRYMPKPPKPKK